LCRAFPVYALHLRTVDALGPFALLAIGADAVALKRFAVELEGSRAAHRLLDVDVYEPTGRPVDRAALGLAPRTCLLCEQAAVDCIRQHRHPVETLSAKVHELLQARAA
jgi:holo-ACP synthase CitX